MDRLNITQEIIDSATCRQYAKCVIARTLQTKWGGSYSADLWSNVRSKGDAKENVYTHDSTVICLINDFDSGVKVKPCTLVIQHRLKRLFIEENK